VIAAIIPIQDRTLAFAQLHDTIVVQHMVNALRASRVLDIILVFDGENENLSLSWFDGAVAFHSQPQNILSSVIVGIETLRSNNLHGVLICPVTTPFLSQSLVVDVLQGFWRSQNNIVVPVHNGQRGNPIVIASPLFDDLIKTSSLDYFLEAHRDDLVEITTAEEGAVTMVASSSNIDSFIIRQNV